MRPVWTVATHHLRIVLKNPASILMMFVMPLMLMLIFGAMGSDSAGSGKRYPVALIDEDNTVASRKLGEALATTASLQVRTAADADLKQLFADKKITAAIRIPAGFEAALRGDSAPDVVIVTAPEGNAQVAIGPSLHRSTMAVASDYRLALRVSQNDGSSVEAAYDRIAAQRAETGATVKVTTAKVEQTKEDAQRTHSPSLGFVIMFVMMMIFFQTGVILQERRDGTWNRLLTTPASRASILGGYLLSLFLTGTVQFTGLVVLTRLAFRAEWGPLLPLAVMAGSFILCAAGIGLLVASLVKTPEQQNVIGTITVVATSMLGGVYWPLDFVSETMRRIGYLTPQAWAMDGFREVMLRGGSFEALLMPVGIMMAIATITLTAGVLRIRYS